MLGKGKYNFNQGKWLFITRIDRFLPLEGIKTNEGKISEYL